MMIYGRSFLRPCSSWYPLASTNMNNWLYGIGCPLTSFMSICARSLARQVVITNRVKSESSVLHYTVDALFDANAQNKQIQFQYFFYNASKEKYYYLKGAYYQVSPYSLIYTDDHYYLLAFVTDENKFKHFRVDHMENASIGDTLREGAEEYKKLDIRLKRG